jgi:hypothetical protein
VSINPVSNLPVAQGFAIDKIPKGVAALNMTMQAVDEENRNLMESEKELLRWHQRLGHMAYARIRALMHSASPRANAISTPKQHRVAHVHCALYASFASKLITQCLTPNAPLLG